MRILHSSDWHLGQHFVGKSRQEEHQAFVAWLLEQVKIHQVDVVLIAGDVFDSGTPPSYAREIYNGLIVSLHDLGASLVVLAGNHDSVATLGESRQLLARLGAAVIPAVTANLEEQLLVLEDRAGQPAALLCAVPFIRPRDVQQSQAGQTAEEKQSNLQEAIHQHYQRLYALAQQRRSQYAKPLPIITTGHLTVVGANLSESVREIYLGSLGAYPCSAFPAADYIALGHIHRAQKVGELEHIRYSGSPIPLSFDELSQAKEVLLVDLNEQGLQKVTPLPVPLFQPLASVKGTLEELALAIPAAAQLALPGRPVWLEITLKGDDYLLDMQARIQALTEALPVEVLRIKRERTDRTAVLQNAARVTLDELTPQEVFNKRLEQEQMDADLKQQLQQRYQGVLAQLRGGAA